MHAHVMLLRYRSANRPTHCLGIQRRMSIQMGTRLRTLLVSFRRSVAAFHLGCDDQTFLVSDIDRERHTTTRPHHRMTLFHGQFDVIGVKIVATNDDQSEFQVLTLQTRDF